MMPRINIECSNCGGALRTSLQAESTKPKGGDVEVLTLTVEPCKCKGGALS